MRYLITILLIVTSLFMSCDGRTTKNESLKNSVSEFNKKQTPIDVVTYFPKEYTEVVSDTIIENSLSVRIKNYTNMNDNVLISESDSKVKKKKLHRVFESEIIVFKEDKTVYNTIINTHLFTQKDESLFWANATLEHVWVNQELSSKDKVNLGVSFLDPKTKAFKLYEITVDAFGNQNIQLKQEHI